MSLTLEPISLAPPRLLVSQCLLGAPVRYDGQHKHQPTIDQHLWSQATAVAVCPEVAAGMGVPRPAIRRQWRAGAEVIALADTGQVVATALPATCAKLVQEFCRADVIGAVLKNRSPSCGIDSSPLFDARGDEINVGDGVFVQQLRRALPQLILVNEEQLPTRAACLQLLRLAQLAMAEKAGLLSQHWRQWLSRSHPLHDEPNLGLSALAKKVGQDVAELHYLEHLPFLNAVD